MIGEAKQESVACPEVWKDGARKYVEFNYILLTFSDRKINENKLLSKSKKYVFYNSFINANTENFLPTQIEH